MDEAEKLYTNVKAAQMCYEKASGLIGNDKRARAAGMALMEAIDVNKGEFKVGDTDTYVDFVRNYNEYARKLGVVNPQLPEQTMLQLLDMERGKTRTEHVGDLHIPTNSNQSFFGF